MKQAFQVELVEIMNQVPVIKKVNLQNVENIGNVISWRDAKKQVRKFYLDKAAALRQLKEKDIV